MQTDYIEQSSNESQDTESVRGVISKKYDQAHASKIVLLERCDYNGPVPFAESPDRIDLPEILFCLCQKKTSMSWKLKLVPAK